MFPLLGAKSGERRSHAIARAAISGWCLAGLTLATAARAEPRAYEVGRQPGEIGITVTVPYSLGTHTEAVAGMSGEVRLDRAALTALRGRLSVPLTSLRSDDQERDCHMREALGLDYSRSKFPRDHVCDAKNRLPATGPNSVAFPEVSFDVRRGAALDDPRLLDEGRDVRAWVKGTWTIHGVRRPARLVVTLSRSSRAPDAIRVRGDQVFSLRDYGVVVKSAKVLFITVSVRDHVTMHLDLVLVPVVPVRQGTSAR